MLNCYSFSQMEILLKLKVETNQEREEDSEDTLIFSLNLICLRVCLDKVKQSSLQQGREQKGVDSVDIFTGEHADDN
jgi:hypothetical protein